MQDFLILSVGRRDWKDSRVWHQPDGEMAHQSWTTGDSDEEPVGLNPPSANS